MYRPAGPFLARALALAVVATMALSSACSDDDGVAADPDALSDASADTSPGDADAGADASPDANVDATPDATPDGSGADAGPEPLEYPIPDGCNPVAFEYDCFYPFPSDVFRIADEAAPGGFRVALEGAAVPVADSGLALDVFAYHPTDGFGVHPPIAAALPFGYPADLLVGPDENYAAAASPDSQTLLLDTSTGELVPHFAELGVSDVGGSGLQLLYIRPAARLRDATRYVVGVVAGPDVAQKPPEVFDAVRSGNRIAGHEAWSDRFAADVLAPLADAGVDTGTLWVAWDFTTRSDAAATTDMRDVRRMAIDWAERNEGALTIDSVQIGDEVPSGIRAHIARVVRGTIEIPLFMENPYPGARLFRDTAGQVTPNGTSTTEFVALVPHSALDPERNSRRAIQFGHGFFGSRDEVVNDFQFELADQLGAVYFAIDWWGMRTEDSADVVSRISVDPSTGFFFTDRVHQGMANQIVFSERIVRQLRAQTALQGGDGEALWDNDRLAFYGISQGHILGGTFLALTPRIDRGVLGSGGASFTFMMSRAGPFAPFLAFINLATKSALTTEKVIALAATPMDRIDPITYAPHLIGDLYTPGPASRSVLMQYGTGDSQVPPLATELHARSAGLPLLRPDARTVPVIDGVEAPASGSALVQYDFKWEDVEPGLFYGLPDGDSGVHGAVRRAMPAREQIDAFLSDESVIDWFCEVPPCALR